MLYVPPAAHAELQANLPATPSTATEGTSVASSGSTNTKGAWVELVTSTDYESQVVCLMISDTAVSAAAPIPILLDIGIGGAGSEQVILPNLLVSAAAQLTEIGAHPIVIMLPLRIPKGARVAGRCQSSTASKTVDVAVFLFEGPSGVSWPTVSRADDYGPDTATSKGAALTPGSTGTESSWASVGSTTSRAYKGLLLLVGASATTGRLSRTYHFEIGIGSAMLAEYVMVGNNVESVGTVIPPWPLMRSIPTGTQLQVRAESSGTADVFDVAVYGLC